MVTPLFAPDKEQELPARKKISLVSAISCVIGGIIGVGIFFQPADTAGRVPTAEAALLVWGVGALLVAFGAMAYAELAGMYPLTGGVYVFLREAYGRLPAFLYAWMSLLVISTGALAAIAIFCSHQLVVLAKGVYPTLISSEGEAVTWLAVFLILLQTVMNARGVHIGAAVQNVTVFLKLAAILALVGVGILAFAEGRSAVQPEAAEPLSLAMFGAALVPVLFSFGGWQNITFIGGEVKHPQRNLPLSIFVGVGVVCLVYLATNWAYFQLLPREDLMRAGSQLPVRAVAAGAGQIGASVIALALFISAFGIANSVSFTYPRLYVAMARDGLFFTPFARLHPRTGAPVLAIWLQGAWAILLLLTLGQGEGEDTPLARLTSGVVFADWIFFGLCGLAVLVLRFTRPEVNRPFRTPGVWVVSSGFTLAAAFAVYAAIARNPSETLYGTGILLAGAVAFWFWSRKSKI